MPSFLDIKLPLPKKSKFNLSHDHASSHCIGTLDPVLCEYLPTNTDVDISVQNVVRTSPAICPVFGSLRQDYHFFFVPMRLFSPAMRLNSLEDETTATFVDVPLPGYPFPQTQFGSGENAVPFKVHETSLLARLGYGVHAATGYSNTYAPPATHFLSSFGVLAYYSIFYNYYLNRQVRNFCGYIQTMDGTAVNPEWVKNPVLSTTLIADDLRSALLSATNDTLSSTTKYLGSANVFRNACNFRGGLLCRSRESDLLTTFVNSASVTAARDYSMIVPDPTDGTITFDQIRTSSAIAGFVERLIASGGRYLDWLTITSGVKTSHRCDIPEYLGSTSGSILFDMITNVSGQDFGDLGGRGQGGVSGRRHRFTNVEPGFLVVLYSIVPHVLYPESTRPWIYGTNLSDFYNTSLDRLSWQDTPYRWGSAAVHLTPGSNTNAIEGWATSYQIGKSPAWFEETSIPSRSSGLLASTLRYWTFGVGNPDASTLSDIQERIMLPYVFPGDFQYIFENPNQDNFFVYHQFRFFARKQKSKNSLPRVL